MNKVATKPSVLLDATAISFNRGGVGRYVEELAREAAISGENLIVVCQERDLDAFREFDSAVIKAPGFIRSVPLRLIWEQFGLPSVAKRVGAEVIHSPHYTFPLFTKLARVVTVHDLTFWSHPDRHNPIKRVFFKFWIRLAARLPRAVVVPSEATANEFRLKTSAKKVFVAHHGVDSEIFHPPTKSEITKFAHAHGVSDWVAFLGTIEPRKNVVPLIRGFRRAIADLKKKPALLLAGAAGWDDAVSGEIIEATRAGFDVRHLGYLPIHELSALLGGAKVVAYPSEGEGFGLPVLEAMACGATVLTADSLAIPEVGGKAVQYSGTDYESIATALSKLLKDEPARKTFAEAALVRSKKFSWSACLGVHLAAWAAATSVPR